jgi:outer membrane protein assembly factor BamB
VKLQLPATNRRRKLRRSIRAGRSAPSRRPGPRARSFASGFRWQVAFIAWTCCLDAGVWADTGAFTNGLVGWWKFDEGVGATVGDSAGTNHGILRGAKWTAGVSGAALLFDVSRAQVEITADTNLDLTEELTICAWLKSENFDTPIVNKLEYWAPGNYDFRTERSGALSLSHEAGPGQPWSHYESSARLTAAHWHHVAVSLKTGAQVRFYVDGEAAGASPQIGRFGLVNREPLRIGAKPDPYSSFHGVIDEVRIFRRELSAGEIQGLAHEFTPPPPTTPAGAGDPVARVPHATLVSPEAAGRVNPKADWPQWLGPERDGISKESGLLKRWPEAGPALAWFVEGLGEGYSTVSISNQRLYTTGMIDRQEVLFAIDLQGQPLWQKTYGPAWRGRYPEARTTPTVNDDHVYVISGMGKVACFDARTGEQTWVVDAAMEFGTKFDFWGIAESPLIIDNLLVCTPSGTNATMAGLDKKTGRTVWASRSLGEESNYGSPICICLPARRLVVTMLKESIIGVDAGTGEILWRVRYADYQPSPHGINPNTPVYYNGGFYTTSGYGCGGALHQLSNDGRTVTRRWSDRVLDCHHGGVVCVDGFLYGSNFKGHYAGDWVCLDCTTGKVMYDQKWICKGSIAFADGLLYCYEEKEGTVGLVRPTPERFDLISSFKVARGTGPHWAHPVICGGRLYLRHGSVLMAFDIRERS